MTRCGDAVEDLREVLELSAERLADGLMAQTDAEDGLPAGVGLDYIQQQSHLARNAGARREDNLAVPSAGSAFKRPEGGFAAALIEQAGLKGYAIGGAQVSEKHAGFVVNTGGASSHDVYDLMMHIRKTVYEHSKIALEPEMILLPPDYKLEDHGPQVPLHSVWGAGLGEEE